MLAFGDTVSQSGHAGQSDNLPILCNFSLVRLRGPLLHPPHVGDSCLIGASDELKSMERPFERARDAVLRWVG